MPNGRRSAIYALLLSGAFLASTAAGELHRVGNESAASTGSPGTVAGGGSVGTEPSNPITSVSFNATISPSLPTDDFSILAIADSHGTISPSGKVLVDSGSSLSFTITPDTGYYIADVHVDTVSVGAVASYTFTGVSANHTIQASFAIQTFSVLSSAGEHGTITPVGKVVLNYGATQKYAITPDAGYYIADVHVDTVSVGAVSTYTFSSISADHIIDASFAINQFSIVAIADSHGTISPSGKVLVDSGSNPSFTITPDIGYYIADVHVDTASVGAVASYTFTGVSANHTIQASFAIQTFSVLSSAGDHGTITPVGKVVLNYGATQKYAITPDAGYYIADVHVDTVSVGAVSTYTFSSISADHTIDASFAINQFSIVAIADSHGTISPAGKVLVDSGSTPSFTITADTGYYIADVHVDTASVGAVASYTFTGVSANHTIEASFAIQTFSVLSSAGDHGTITPLGKVVLNYGATQKYAITPDAGYYIADVHVDTVSVGAVPKYTFSNVSANHTIEASFGIQTFSVFSTAGEHGTITPLGKVVLNYGATQKFAITADVGYHLEDVLVDGVSVGAVTSYMLTNVTATHTIDASFAINQFSIVAIADSHGTISPSGKVFVDSGSTPSFTITPDTGYYIADVHVDTISVGAVPKYTFSSVSANHTIEASFATRTFSILSSAGNHGTITPSGKVILNYGATQNFAIVPDTGYYIADVHVDTVSVGAVPKYTFSNVSANHTIEASFAIQTFSVVSSAGEHGTITPLGKVVFNYGASQKYSITPDTGYHVLDVVVDGSSVGALTSYMLTNVTATHTIAASFTINRFSIVAIADSHGTISPSGKVFVDSGSSPSFAIAPDSGYYIADVHVDSVSIGPASMYKFSNVVANHIIEASFATHPVPQLTGISPAEAFRGETINIVLTGANFVRGGVTDLNVGSGISVKTLEVRNPDSLLATIKVGSEVAPGSRSFSVTNSPPGGGTSGPVKFTVLNHSPSAFNLVAPANGDTIKLTTATQPVQFTWHASADLDPADTLVYTLHVPGLAPKSESFLIKNDTTVSLEISNALELRTTYSWTVSVTDGFDTSASIDTFIFRTSDTRTSVVDRGKPIPKEYSLHQNYPNPFNPGTTIRFDLPRVSTVTLVVYNILGQEVVRLLDHRRLEAGFEEVTFNAGEAPSGVYLYRLSAEGGENRTFVKVRKMVLLK